MPELPEVETTTQGLKKTIIGYEIIFIWTDIAKKNQPIKHFKSTIKDLDFFNYFQKNSIGAKIKSVARRAKNILINLDNSKTVLVHLKMTGHLLVGKYEYNKKQNKWTPVAPQALKDPYNRHIHLVMTLIKNGKEKHLVMCDSRKFGKVTMLDSKTVHQTAHLNKLGPEPLLPTFRYEDFKSRLSRRPKGQIKTVLLDQETIAGIGNIYSDEMLWMSSVHPESIISSIPAKQLKKIFISMKEVLNAGINFGGDSMSDYRRVDGTPGDFQNKHNVYRKQKTKCKFKNCKGIIVSKKVGARTAHFCEMHQKLYK